MRQKNNKEKKKKHKHLSYEERVLKANHKHIKLLKIENMWFYQLLLKELKSNKGLSVDTIIGRYRSEKWKTLVSTAKNI